MNFNFRISFIFCLILFWIGTYGQDKILVLPDTSYVVTDPGFELLLAAIEGDTLKINALFQIGVDVNYSNAENITALMFAAEAGHLRAVEILLHQGAIVNVFPNNHVDALLGACIAGNVFVADTLLQNGANVNTINFKGISPLMYAAAYNQYILADMLLFYKARVNLADEEGNVALMYSVFYGNSEMLALLVDHGADVNSKDNAGFTPLMIAAQNGHLPEVEYLLEREAEVNAENDEHLTALSLAIINGHMEIVQLLLSHGANANHNISNAQNQFSLAREYQNKAMKNLLLDNGANKNYKPAIRSLNLGFVMTTAKKDFLLGAEAVLNELKYGLALRMAFKIRPFTRSAIFPINEEVSYQMWEKRSVLCLGIDKQFVMGRFSVNNYGGLFGGIDFSYTYGSFRGSNKKPVDQFLIVPRAGLFWNFNFIYTNLNYEYFPLENSKSSPHRINISIGYKWKFKKNRIQIKKEPQL